MLHQHRSGRHPLVARREVRHGGGAEHILDGARHVGPEPLQPAPGVLEARVIRGLQAEHREQLSLDGVGDLRHRDLALGPERSGSHRRRRGSSPRGPALVSAPSCCSRKRSGTCWRSAISRAGTKRSSSRRCASSIMARIAYSSFWDTFSMGDASSSQRRGGAITRQRAGRPREVPRFRVCHPAGGRADGGPGERYPPHGKVGKSDVSRARDRR